MIDPDYQGEIGLLIVHNGGKEDSLELKRFSGHRLSTCMSSIKNNEKLKQPKIKSRVLENSEPLKMKIWVISPSKESQPVEVLTEGRGNTEWLEENGSHRYEL